MNEISEIAQEMREWASVTTSPLGQAVEIWANRLDKIAMARAKATATDIIDAINAAGTAQAADAVYVQAYSRILDLPVFDRLFILEALTLQVARLDSDWAAS